MSERGIVSRLFENRRLSEAEFQSGGNTYKTAFGRYYKNGEQIDRDAYFKAKEELTGGESTPKDTPVKKSATKDVGISNYAQEAGTKLRGSAEDSYFYDNGDKQKFSSATENLSSKFSEAYPNSSKYMLSKSQTCIYDEETGVALIVKTSDRPNKSWAQIKKLSPEEVAKLKPTDYLQQKQNKVANEVSEEEYQSVKERVKSQGYRKSNDEDLVVLSNKGDDRAQEEIITRYEKLVRHVAKDLFLPGGDQEDLVQEGLLGLVSAMKDYKPGSNKNFKQFAVLAAKRNMLDAIDAANTQRNAPLNQADDYETALSNKPTSNKSDPESSAMQKADKDRLTSYMKDNLTKWEMEVLGYYLKGYNYDEIADKTGKNNKSINNAMNMVRSKLRKYKELYKESALVESILESIESRDTTRMRESYKILFN